jgi:hypothetical protein
MFIGLKRLLEDYKSNTLVVAIVSVIVGALFTKLVPSLWRVLTQVLGWIGKRVGGRLAYRHFEKEYLNWLAISARELKLAGVVTYDDVKKPQLEQVFVSIRVGEHRGSATVNDLAILISELFYSRHPDLRRSLEKEDVEDLVRAKLSILTTDQLQAAEESLLRELESRNILRRWASNCYRYLKPRKKKALVAVIASQLNEIIPREMSESKTY